jgi:hypothetical protein
MGESSFVKKRRTFKWSAQAREVVNANLKTTGYALRQIVTQLVEMTGNPRSACRRFVYRMGSTAKIRYKRWPVSEQQRLLELLDKYSVSEASRMMRCSRRSIYAVLRRLKISARMRQDAFSKSRLADVLHIRYYEVDSWIRKGWLQARVIQIGQVRLTVIKPDDFVKFCQKYREAVIGNRLNLERLEFVYKYVFPPDHNYLLSVRASKKERAAFGSSESQTSRTIDGEPVIWGP